jgi:Na+-driven multidrug efflux pump
MGLTGSPAAIGTTCLGSMSGYFVFLGVLVAHNAGLSSRGRMHWLMYNSFTVAAVNLLLASLFVLVFHGGIRGVVRASVISVATATVLAVWLVPGRLQVRFFLRGAVRAMLVAGINLWRWRTGRWKTLGITQPLPGAGSPPGGARPAEP